MDDLKLDSDALLYNQNGTEMSEESFFHINDGEIIYVKSKGKQ